MADDKKTIPEQFGQMALGFATIIGKIDGEKAKNTKDEKAKKQSL